MSGSNPLHCESICHQTQLEKEKIKPPNIHFCSMLVFCPTSSGFCSTFEHSPSKFPTARSQRHDVRNTVSVHPEWQESCSCSHWQSVLKEFYRQVRAASSSLSYSSKGVCCKLYTSKTTVFNSCDSVWVCETDRESMLWGWEQQEKSLGCTENMHR